MHTILIRTAFSFAVDCNDLSVSESNKGLRRECNLWSKGIHWFNLQGSENYLELREDGQVYCTYRCDIVDNHNLL